MHSSFCLLAQIVEIMGGSLYQIYFKGSHMKRQSLLGQFAVQCFSMEKFASVNGIYAQETRFLGRKVWLLKCVMCEHVS